MGKGEFIALAAFLMAVNSLAIDIMLPALQQIGASLGVESENHRQFVVSAYLLGFGSAQLFYGPLSDRFGRRLPLLIGLVIYICSALGIALVPSFAGLLALRFIQGIGSAATRVITISIVRDIYGGRQMAEVMSLIMMVFMIVPVIAPGSGQIIMFFGSWHLIFVFIAVLAALISVWAYIRLPETLRPANVRPFTARSVIGGFKLVLTNRIALCYTIATTFIFGSLFGFINSAQQIYVGIYELGVYFPFAFAGVAVFMSLSSFLNARLVGRFGMRRLSHGALVGFITVNTIWLAALVLGPQPMPFAFFICFFGVAMFQFGWIGSNFNSLAMEPLGHVAGTASSVLGFMSTVGGALIGAGIGQAFNGTALPMVAGYFTVSIIGLVFVLIAEKGRLFQPHNPAV
ncbi:MULTISPECIES: multidrug effflux MFS transporter [Rhizobium]|jgi:DHA1 family bicyclomycin/chloramphenicol resistance-like MFS transporter|uniref:Bcr/CflA family efflux transporter n=1 Tax=Rhizobium altiplani TaxID=1864509 RepID=A0A109JL08_9HYPH|nr:MULTISPECIES: multidrug effflux MFS transporter [Rhizobium]KWV51012.1 MFS transporter [Rhizobium altiplani]MBD9445365.1 multidrug effflux MFS transporter [Rhizobium sp. RHZ01]MBD9453079.1 multidrug effflux MFS transporter [Rhizobium sp. RHZ02]NMN69258.1 DHA1 family bicyclomycin/chloramphenicol resistance-like MFS transporter [Rhizobium sp. 57MFTsu3.2]